MKERSHHNFKYMKYLNIILILLVFLFVACDEDPKRSDIGQQSSESNQDVNAQVQSPACVEGSFVPALAPGNSYYEQLAQMNWWVMEYYINTQGPKDRLDRSQTGRWFKFEADGTFTEGQWEEQIGYGTWRMTERDGKTFLFVDNFCNNRDGEWEVQDANNAEDAMSWNGMKGYSDGGAIVKIINLLSRPTKKQFGYE